MDDALVTWINTRIGLAYQVPKSDPFDKGRRARETKEKGKWLDGKKY